MKKTAKVLLLSLLTLGMTVGCAGRTQKSSAPAPSSEAPISQPDSSIDATSNPISSSTPAPDTSSAAPSSEIGSSVQPSSSSAMPSSSSEAPSSSAQPSSSSEAPSSSAAPVAISLTLNTNSVKKNYAYGEALDLSGLVANLNYDNGTSEAVTGYTANPANGTIMDNPGNNTITISYSGFNATFDVFVNNPPKVLMGINLDIDDVKVDYIIGEALDLTGLVVNANYDDGSSEAVTGFTSDPVEGTVLNELGDAFVTISYETFDADFMISVSPAPKSNWTDEEAAIMAAHLYGEVLPYNGLEESVVGYNSTYDYVYISGGEIDAEGIAEYADVLSNDGWELYGQSGTSYGFEKEVENEDGDARMLRIYLGIDVGEFYLEASDPFYYEFPEEFVEEVAYDYFGSVEYIPVVDAWYYEVDEDYLYMACHGEFESDDGGYLEALGLAGWDIMDETDDDGYYVAVSPDGRYEIAFLAIPNNDVMYIYFEPVKFWNAALILEFFNAYGFDPFDVPPFEAADGMYQFIEDSYNDMYAALGYEQYINASMYVYGATSAELADYLDALAVAGWMVSQTGEASWQAQLLIPDEGLATIEIAFGNYVTITIYGMLGDLPAAEWPADEIADILGDDVTDVLPEYDGDNNGFYLLNDSYGTAVQVLLEAGIEEDALEYYITVLTEDYGYEEYGPDSYGDMQYISENGQILVTPYIGTSGSITIAFKQYVLFPVDEVNDALQAVDSTITDLVPGIDGANSYYVYTADPSYVQVQCNYGAKTNATAAQAAYIDILQEAGFTYVGLDTSSNPGFDSPKGQFNVVVWIYYYSSYDIYYLILDITPGSFVPAESGWPLAEITAMLDDEDLAKMIPVPTFASTRIFGVETSSYADFIIYSSTNDPDLTDDLVDSYTETLIENGWVENGTDSYGDMHYTDPDNILDVNPTAGYSSGNIFVIEVNVVPPPKQVVPWPAEEVAAFLGEHWVDNDVLPPLEGGTSYTFNDNYNYADAAIIVEIDNPSTAATAYYALLEEEGWEYTGTTSGQKVYTSPNEELTVSLWVRTSSGYINMEINWLNEPATPTIEWPAEEVAAFLLNNGNVTDTLPEFPGLTDIGYTTDYSYADAAIYCYCDDPTGTRDVYQAALVEAGWELTGTAYGQNVYTSPHGQMTVSLYVQTSYGRITLEINWLNPEPPVAEWPGDAINSLMDDFGYENTLPAAECAFTSVDVNSNTDYIMLFVNIDGDEDAIDDAMSEYCAVLEDAGFEYLGADEYGDYYFLSPDGDYQVDIYVEEEGFGINIGWFMDLPEDDKWPVELSAMFEDYGFEDVLPEYEGEYESAEVYFDDDDNIVVDIKIDGDSSDFALAVLSYVDTLDNEGFEFEGSDDQENMYYVSPSGEYELTIAISENGFMITITPLDEPFENEFYDFPMDLIVEYYPTANGVLPSIDDASMFYVDPGSDQDYFIMDVYYDESVNGAESRANFIAALEEAGFTYEEVDEGEYGYVSPDGDFVIFVYAYSSEEGYFTIDIATMAIFAVE